MKKTFLLICLTATAAASAETISLEVSGNPAFRQYSANAKVGPAFKSIQNECGDFAVAPLSLSPKKGCQIFRRSLHNGRQRIDRISNPSQQTRQIKGLVGRRRLWNQYLAATT